MQYVCKMLIKEVQYKYTNTQSDVILFHNKNIIHVEYLSVITKQLSAHV